MIPYQQLINKKYSIGEKLYTDSKVTIEWVENFAKKYVGKTVIAASAYLDGEHALHLREDNWKPYEEVKVVAIEGVDLTGALHKARGGGGFACPLVRFVVAKDGKQWALRLGSHEAFESKSDYAKYAKQSKALHEEMFKRQMFALLDEAERLTENCNGNIGWFMRNYEDLGLDSVKIRGMVEGFYSVLVERLSKIKGIKAEVSNG